MRWYHAYMLYRASVLDVKQGRVSTRYGYLVVVMQHYPRFVKKDLIHEYLRVLAPEKGLFTEFKALARQVKDHNRAFAEINYEQRFEISLDGRDELARLGEMAASRDVYLICQCASLERCHADLLLLFARLRYGANAQTPRLSYPIFEKRLLEE